MPFLYPCIIVSYWCKILSYIQINYMKKLATTYKGHGDYTIYNMYMHLVFRNYSKYTITAYIKEFNHLCVHYNLSPKLITEDQIHSYLFYLAKIKNFGPNKIAVAMASFTYFYHNIVVTPEKVARLRSPIIPDRVPFILTPKQVFQFIEALHKFKDKVIIQLLYSTGIRVSECVNIRIRDINVSRMAIRIVEGKGKKGRYVPLSPLMLSQLNLYYKKYEPKDYLFYGRGRNYKVPMCRATVNRIIRKAKNVLETSEIITPHTFRHSFATTLVEEGESLFKIQKILGHANILSTIHYTKSARPELKSCVNPLDKIYEEKGMLELV